MKLSRWLLPSPADAAAILLLVCAAIVRGWQAVNTDGDLGRHIRVGETILERGGLFHADLFSWTMAGQPFVPYEWLSEVLFALAHRAAGLPGVVAMAAICAAAAYFLLALFLRRRGVDPLLAFGVTIAAGLVSAFHWLARPHLFTLVGTILVVWLMERPTDGETGGRADGQIGRFALAAVLFAVWANLHGGFLFGLVLIGMYLAGDAIADRRRLRDDALILGAALLGSFVNPVGPALLLHVTGYLGQAFLLDATLEYRSPDFHAWWGRAFLSVLLAGITALAVSRRLPIRRLVVVLATTAFALHSARNIPLWALTTLPILALHLDSEWRERSGGLVGRLRAAFTEADGLARPGPWAAVAALALAALALGGGRLGGAQLLQHQFDERVFPVETVRRARAAGLTGRMYNELAWGGYILHSWPEQRVFIDGQTDFYGETLAREYVALRAADEGWRERLARREVELVILPPDAPLARELVRNPAWSVWHGGRGAVLFRRAP